MTGHNIGEFERAVDRCEKAERALYEALEFVEFDSVDKFLKYYLPGFYERYPFTIRVSKEEKELIEFRRGNLKKEDNR